MEQAKQLVWGQCQFLPVWGLSLQEIELAGLSETFATMKSEVNNTQPVGCKKRNLRVWKKGHRIANKLLSVHNLRGGRARKPGVADHYKQILWKALLSSRPWYVTTHILQSCRSGSFFCTAYDTCFIIWWPLCAYLICSFPSFNMSPCKCSKPVTYRLV